MIKNVVLATSLTFTPVGAIAQSSCGAAGGFLRSGIARMSQSGRPFPKA